MLPRWKGIVWTAQAERDAERQNDALSRIARRALRAKTRKKIRRALRRLRAPEKQVGKEEEQEEVSVCHGAT